MKMSFATAYEFECSSTFWHHRQICSTGNSCGFKEASHIQSINIPLLLSYLSQLIHVSVWYTYPVSSDIKYEDCNHCKQDKYAHYWGDYYWCRVCWVICNRSKTIVWLESSYSKQIPGYPCCAYSQIHVKPTNNPSTQ